MTATLTDSFGRQHTYLRLAVTDRCNLRCRYCMPEECVGRLPEELLSDEEIVRAAGLFAREGVEKIRLTGGEPTMRPDLPALVARLVAVPGIRTVAMTTNGLLLPELAGPLREAGLAPHGLNLSLDSLQRERYQLITGSDTLAEALAGLEAARAAGFAPLKVNVVVMAGVNDDELGDFVAFAIAREVNVRFIEYMPFRGNQWAQAAFLPYAQMKATIGARYELTPVSDNTAGVAKDFHVAGAAGRVSFITPISDNFCATCSRLRLTADGELKTCLFSPAELSLRDLLRGDATDEEITTLLRVVVAMKPQQHPPVEELLCSHARSMLEIGG